MILLAWIGLYAGARIALEAPGVQQGGLRVLVALIPVPMFAAFLLSFVRGLRSADELERRIQLEALAVAFPLGLLLLTTLGLVQRAVSLSFENWSYNHVWPMFATFYLLGLVLARKRYT